MPPDKLVSRIKTVLKGESSHFEMQNLAQEYAELMARLRERLEQCVALIRSGNDYAALQVAETSPPLLDSIAQLVFAESPQWREFCRERNVPWAPPLDQHQVDLANSLYGLQISESHPFYRDYRQAIRERDELRALAVLTSIIRVNPNDINARGELSRLVEKVRDIHLRHLDALLDAGDDSAAFALADKLSGLRLPAFSASPALRRACERREANERALAYDDVAALLRDAAACRAAGDWRAAVPFIGRCRMLEHHHCLVLDGAAASQLADIESWAARCQHEDSLRQARKESVRQATQALTGAVDAATHAHGAQLRKNFHRLQGALASAEPLVAPEGVTDATVDAALVASARKLCRTLGARLQRRGFSYATAFAGVLLAGALGAYSAWTTYEDNARCAAAVRRMRDFSSAERHFHEAEVYSASIAYFPTGWEKNPDYAAARDAFVQWVSAHRRQLDAMLAEASTLAVLPVDATTPEQLYVAQSAFEKLRHDVAGLSTNLPDTRGALQPGLDHARARLEAIHKKLAAESLPPALRLFEQFKSRHATMTQATLAPDVRARTLEAFIAELGQAPALSHPPLQALLPASEVERWKALLGEAHTALSRHQQTTRTNAALATARTLDAHLAILNADATALAKSVLAATAHLQNPPRALLTPEAYELWQTALALSPDLPQPFLPSDTQPGEASDATRLALNKAHAKLHRYVLRTFPASAETPETPVYTIGPVLQERLPIGNGYELRQTADVLKPDGATERRTYSFRQFGPNTIGRGETLADGAPTPESIFLPQFARFYDVSAGRITEPLLGTLERIHAAPRLSPLFRAYLQQEIFKIIATRPHAWGLSLSPAAQRDATRLNELTHGNLTPNDWLEPERWRDTIPALSQHYEHPRPAYLAEAHSTLRLFRRLATPGFIYAGHIDSEKKLKLHHPLPAASHALAILAPDGQLTLHPLAASGEGIAPHLPPARLQPYSPVYMLNILPDAAAATLTPSPPIPPEGWQQHIFRADPTPAHP
ncbi:MAG: hypothetical protein LBD14_05755 [Puniceicoccales bacterium]|jgi:hypothetical protein|nr:hypothetical protein [Puniceicoccales bacterium]